MNELPIEDAALEDVRESARHNDWCAVCGQMFIYVEAAGTCGCASRGFSNPSPVSMRAILARLDDDARTIEQLTRSVHAVKDAEIAALCNRISELKSAWQAQTMIRKDRVIELQERNNDILRVEVDTWRRRTHILTLALEFIRDWRLPRRLGRDLGSDGERAYVIEVARAAVEHARRRLRVDPPLLYVASRASLPERPAMWRALRALGYNIVSTWIDEAGPGETASMADLWTRVIGEIASADRLVLYVEPDDFPLKGALVEVGAALALGREVYIVAPNVRIGSDLRPIGSWLAHPNVTVEPNLMVAMGPAPVGVRELPEVKS